MEDQRGGEMRNKRNSMSTNADEGVQKTANGGGLFTADHSTFDIHRGQKFMGNATVGENVHRLTAGKDAEMTVPTFISGGGGGGGDGNAINDTNGWTGVIGHGRRRSSLGVAKRPILPPRLSFRSSGYVDYEESVNQEFGRNTNRLDYFRVDPFDVYGDHHLPRVGSFGGGGGPRQEYEGGGDSHVSHVAGGGMKIRPVPVGLSANGGGEGVVERLDHRGGNEGGGGSREVVGPRLEQERGGGATAGAGSVDGTREVPVGTFGDNCGETVVQKLKQEGATVAVPVVVVAVAVAVMVVMMMVLVMVMVVLVSVMAKMESRR